MTIDRRAFFRLTGLLAAATAASACGPLTIGEMPMPTGALVARPRLHRALGRLTYGPRADELERASELGLGGWIEEQLDVDAIEEPLLRLRLGRFDSLRLDADLLEDWKPHEVVGELRQATLLRRTHSRRQLYEMMVEFWSDHFNISVDKTECWYLKTVDDRKVIRAHAMGNFHTLLHASARSPAMLVYLDNHVNRRGAPNENYARELLELHTLGIDGGYTQQDVEELARCLTGWTVRENFWRGAFAFDPDAHDEGVKHVLGMRIAPAGPSEAERVIDYLALHPTTARYVATRLTTRFLGDAPQKIVAAASEALIESGGEIRAMLRPILFDGVAGDAPLAPRFKRPNDLVVSALRQLHARSDGGLALHRRLASMGQGLFDWPMPDGYPEQSEAWVSNLAPRWRYALDLVDGRIEGSEVDIRALRAGLEAPHEILDRLATRLLGAPLDGGSAHALLATSSGDGHPDPDDLTALLAAALVASPAFQWR